jgi:hypothetical protein
MGIPLKQYLYGAIVFATVLIVLLNYLIFQTPETAIQQFGAITLYFVFVSWTCGKLWSIRTLERLEAGRIPVSIADIRLEEPALSLAETYLNLGESIDTVCAMVEPRFADWTPGQRASFREALLVVVQERRSKHAGGEQAGL